MKSIKYTLIIIFALVLLCSSKSNAQYGNEVYLNYNFGVPLGDSKEYVPNVSFIGAELNLKRFVKPNLSLSLSFGWNVFFKETTELLSLPNADISGKQNRYINTIPLLAGGQLYFKGSQGITPYIGANLGALFLSRRLSIGVYDLTERSWHFLVQPELGLVFNISHYSDVAFGLTYNYATGSTSDITGKSVKESWIGIKLGYGWKTGF